MTDWSGFEGLVDVEVVPGALFEGVAGVACAGSGISGRYARRVLRNPLGLARRSTAMHEIPVPQGDGAPVPSAGEAAGHHRLPWAGELPQGTRPTDDRHQDGFRRSENLWSRAVTPVQVGRRQANAAREAPPRQLRAANAVR